MFCKNKRPQLWRLPVRLEKSVDWKCLNKKELDRSRRCSAIYRLCGDRNRLRNPDAGWRLSGNFARLLNSSLFNYVRLNWPILVVAGVRIGPAIASNRWCVRIGVNKIRPDRPGCLIRVEGDITAITISLDHRISTESIDIKFSTMTK